MPAKFAYFITGTDTDIGKTLVTGALLNALTLQGMRAAGMKPVAAGAVLHGAAWHSADTDFLASASNVALPAGLATPYLLREATAPHIAAARENVALDLAPIRAAFERIGAMADAVVVEGVGGFRVPLSNLADTADMAQEFDLPMILVVGLRLGCLNHALLTAEAIAARGLTMAGWVANIVDPDMPYQAENIAALTARLPGAYLGCVPRLAVPSASAAAAHLDFSRLPAWPRNVVSL